MYTNWYNAIKYESFKFGKRSAICQFATKKLNNIWSTAEQYQLALNNKKNVWYYIVIFASPNKCSQIILKIHICMYKSFIPHEK